MKNPSSLASVSRGPASSWPLVFAIRIYSLMILDEITSMKKAIALFVISAFLSAFNIAQAQPTITVQPQSRTNNVGDNAQFFVTATGSGTLTYQWQFNGVNIAGTTATNNVLVSDTSKAGNYRVLVSDTSGLTNTSSVAGLSVLYGNRTKITQWNFNSTSADANTGTGATAPSIGSGTVAQVGGVSQNGFNFGSSSDPASSGTDNSSRRWNNFPSTLPDKTGGFRYSVSTVGYESIAFSGDFWISSKSSGYWITQYTVNGTDWIDRILIDRRAQHTAGYTGFVYFTDDLTGVAGVANNASFGYRFLAIYQSTATGSGAAAYVSADGTSYNNTGLSGWDMVRVLGTSLGATPLKAEANTITRQGGASVKVLVSTLLNNDTSPGAKSLTAVSALSASGNNVETDGTYVFYSINAADPSSDTFTYTLSDGTYTDNGTVTVNKVTTGDNQSSNMQPSTGTPGTGDYTIHFHGIPGRTYRIQWAPTVTGTWTTLVPGTATVGSDGVGSYIDSADHSPDNAFYRTVYP